MTHSASAVLRPVLWLGHGQRRELDVRKLDDLDVEAIRERFERGETVAALAEAFSVSERHVRRLCEGLDRGRPPFAVDPGESVEVALRRFLEGVGDDAFDGVRAAAALALARRLDAADSRAAPALARGVVDLVAEISGLYVPDALDELKRRVDARKLALVAGHQGP